MAVVVKDRICRQCGASFPGGPRAWYCPTCRADRQREQSRRFKQTGPRRPLGSIDHCKVCGKEYIVLGGLQMYCKDCAPEAVRKIDNKQSVEWNEKFATAEYRKAVRDRAKKPKICPVCGSEFFSNTPAITCSKECAEAQKRRVRQKYEHDNRDAKNKRQRENRRKMLESMTPEELADYREKLNARARENYRRRKEAK